MSSVNEAIAGALLNAWQEGLGFQSLYGRTERKVGLTHPDLSQRHWIQSNLVSIVLWGSVKSTVKGGQPLTCQKSVDADLADALHYDV